jgi:hypothetical protein
VNDTSIEFYLPHYLFKGPRPRITAAPASVTYGKTFSVQTPDAGDISGVTFIRLSSVTHAFNQNQRLNWLPFSKRAGKLDILAPANANICPPGHYMLFILNGNGVPSWAPIIRIR